MTRATAFPNETLEVIRRRRSIRDGFRPDPVPTALLEEVVAAGMAAPSSKNARPWRLHIVADQSLLRRMADEVQASRDAEAYRPHDPVTGEPWADWVSTVVESAEVLRVCRAGIFIENRGPFSRGWKTLASVPREHLEESLIGYTFEAIGIGAAIENLWLAATAVGLGGTFLGDVVVAEEAIADLLGIDGDLLGVLALGLIDEDTKMTDPGTAPYDAAHVRWH